MTKESTGNNANPVALAEELKTLLARHAAQAGDDRRLPDENVQALEATNPSRLMTPRRWNGYDAPLTTAIRTRSKTWNQNGKLSR
jgi:hypothetical protein